MTYINCEAEDCVHHHMGKGKCTIELEDISILEGGGCSNYLSKEQMYGEEEE